MDELLTLLKQYAVPDLTPGYLREFHAEVFKAIADGKLTEDEIKKLELRKEELGLSDEALGAIRQDLYMAAFIAVSEDERVSDDEWQELEHIQDYLGLSDKDVSKSKKHLYRLRILTELRKGNLPIVTTDEIILEKNEAVHWIEKVDVLMPEAQSKESPEKWSKEGEGIFIITSHRVVIKGTGETRSHAFSQIVSVDCRADGVIFHRKNKRPVFMRYKNPDNRDVAASILLAALEAHKG